MRMKRSLAGSLVLHAVLFLFALIFIHPRGWRVHRHELSPMIVEVMGPSGSVEGSSFTNKSDGKKSGRSKSGSRRKGERRPPDLKDLGVFSRSGTPKSHENASSGNGGLAEPESPYGFENQMTTRSSPILTYLFWKINGAFGYPQDLRNAHLSGVVTAKLNFDEHGNWIDSVSEIKGDNYFRVYLIHQLRECLKEGIPKDLWKTDPHPLTIDAQFTFDIVAPESVQGAQVGPQYAASADPTKFSTVDMDGGQSIESQVIATRQGMYGRKFQFYRVHLSSPLDWKFGPFSGYGIAPTVGIDPGWIVDKIGNLIHPKARIDPLEHYRDDPDW